MSNSDPISGINTTEQRIPERIPRNIIWAGAAESPLSTDTLNVLRASAYSHVFVCFLHFDPATATHPDPRLVYNGPYPVENFNTFWPQLQGLKIGSNPKTLMISIGGWGSGTWNNIRGLETAAARILARFVVDHGFDGVDLNFEGPPDVRFDPALLQTVALFAMGLREALGHLFITLTPMMDNVVDDDSNQSLGQLDAINKVVPAGRNWQDVVSWVNIEFDTYQGYNPGNDPGVIGAYRRLMGQLNLTEDRMVIGFGLWGEGSPGETPEEISANEARFGTNNRIVLHHAIQTVKTLMRDLPNFGGVFAWNYRASKLPPDLNWAVKMLEVLPDAWAPRDI